MHGNFHMDSTGRIQFTITFDEEYAKEFIKEIYTIHNDHVELFGFEHVDNLRTELISLYQWAKSKQSGEDVE